MSVQSKVKRCNKEIKKLEQKVKELESQNCRLKQSIIEANYNLSELKLYENVIKFAVTNHLGGLDGGVTIDARGIDKMQSLSLKVKKDFMGERYLLKVGYKNYIDWS